MIIIGSIIVLAIFLGTGWAIATEMFQHRQWRHRVESGDVPIVAALIEEAMAIWRRARPPKGVPASLWAGVQGAQLVAVTLDSATLSASADGEFRTEEGHRVQVASALDEAIALASKLIDMMLYDVPNLRLGRVRVDVYSTFTGSDGVPVQQPILTTTADRTVADTLSWEALTTAEVLGRFQTRYDKLPSGQGAPIVLDSIEGTLPEQPEATQLEESS
jgi:hypothetical protein